MLHIHRAERADGLVEALRDVLSDPLPDPFAAEVVAVPTRGMERWLTQRLSAGLGVTAGRGDGICANVGFPPPRRLAGDAVAAATGVDPDTDPWLPERAVWPLLDVVDASLDEPWLAVLADHLRAGEDELRRARRFSTVRHLADLFDRYALHRPEMVRGWAAGTDPRRGRRGWQPELWRRLRTRIGTPSLAERLADACDRLRRDPDVVDLPERLSLFGLTRLAAGHLGVLAALAAERDVHAFLLHPSPGLWDRLAGEPPVVRRAEDHTAKLPANRLVASWGQDARELQLVLAAAGAEVADQHHPLPEHAPATLLERLQADVRADRAPAGEPLPDQDDGRPVLDPDDRSVRIHACHGRARQVEVVRDAILHELERDPSLEPRDVIVMCPDIETFAPLIHATFGAGDVRDDDEDETVPARPDDGPRAPDLRVRLADRSLRQTNPVLGVIAQLVDVAEQRLTASQVLDLADREPVRRRFGFDDEAISRIEQWVADSGIRWGLDAEHRAPYRLDQLAAGTWKAGLDRVLLGVAMTEDDQRLVGGVLPLDDVESGVIDVAGRLAELVDRLHVALDELAAPKPIGAWAAALAEAADALTATSPRDAWQRAELQRILDDVVDEATAGGELPGTTLTLAELRALLSGRLQGRPTRANFRTGHLTICTLVPMRSVPHRVVCLLGLDDAVFPRRSPRDGDDLMLDDPHVGERDPRSEDRQQLLDALMAARDRLIVTYTGRDERTNVPKPPAVPVGELLDVVDRTVRGAAGAPARRQIVTDHPLQPFDPRNFRAGALADGRPWSFDPVTLDGARALAGPRTAPGPFLADPLDRTGDRVVELDALVRFCERPARAFLRQRLGISVFESDDDVADALPIELDGLERWQVADRMLAARMGGAPLDLAVAAEVARGALPPGELAVPVIGALRPVVEQLAGLAEQLLGGPARPGSVDVKVELEDGRRLSGTVPGVCGDLLLNVTYSRVNHRHRLAAWVRWLALIAAHPSRPFEAATVGRVRSGVPRATLTDARLKLDEADPAARRAFALRELETLLDLYDRGMCEPLPLFGVTSGVYAETARAGGDPEAAAAKAWESTWRIPMEDKDPEHQLVLGGVLSFEALLERAPDLGRYATRLWSGLLEIEEVRDR